MALKENRVVVLARNETTFGVDAIAPNLATAYLTDALLCSEFEVATDTDVIERNNYNPSLSNEQSGIARATARFTFRTELRSSGVLGTPPRIGRLFKASNMAETIVPAGAASQIGTPATGGSSAGAVALAAALTKTTPPSVNYDTYRLTVVTPGAQAAAQALVTSPAFPEGDGTVMDSAVHTAVTNSVLGTVVVGGTAQAPTFTMAGTWAVNDFVELFIGGTRFYEQFLVADTIATVQARLRAAIILDQRFAPTAAPAAGVLTITLSAAAGPKALTAGALPLGTSGAVVTVGVWAGAVVVGDFVDIPLRRVCVRYDPVSDDGSTVTLWAFLDGALYRLTGARGSWAVTGEAARYPTIAWTFTGNYVDPIDMPLPASLVYEDSKPYKVEVAELAIYGLAKNLACASRFAMDIANEVVVRDCINADEAYDGTQIVSRAPTAGADPEASKPSVFNPWSRLRRGDTTRFHVKVGSKGGPQNTVRLQADAANYTGAPFTVRNGIRAYDLGLRLARRTSLGDDELSVVFG